MPAVKAVPSRRWRAWTVAGLVLVLQFALGGTASAKMADAAPASAIHAAAIAAPARTAAPGSPRGASRAGPASLKGHRHARVCSVPAKRRAACDAVVDLDVSGPLTTSTTVPSGYGPADLQAAYSLPSAASGRGVTVAIVDAYDAPTAAADLAAYRSQYGLPPCGAGCFTKLNQTGGTALPPVDAGWAQETSLDLDMVAATCPNLIGVAGVPYAAFGAGWLCPGPAHPAPRRRRMGNVRSVGRATTMQPGSRNLSQNQIKRQFTPSARRTS
jgi:hypothetical protein